MLHPVFLPLQSLLIEIRVSAVCWLSQPYYSWRSSQFESVWCSLMVGPRICVLGRSTTRSHCILLIATYQVSQCQWVLLLVVITLIIWLQRCRPGFFAVEWLLSPLKLVNIFIGRHFETVHHPNFTHSLEHQLIFLAWINYYYDGCQIVPF